MFDCYAEYTCRLLEIPDDIAIGNAANVRVENDHVASVYETVTFRCKNPSLQLVGATESSCGSYGRWETALPTGCGKRTLNVYKKVQFQKLNQ